MRIFPALDIYLEITSDEVKCQISGVIIQAAKSIQHGQVREFDLLQPSAFHPPSTIKHSPNMKTLLL